VVTAAKSDELVFTRKVTLRWHRSGYHLWNQPALRSLRHWGPIF